MIDYSLCRFIPLVGLAGCGKSAIVAELKSKNEQVLSIEDAAGVLGVCMAGFFGESVIGQLELEQRLAAIVSKFDLSRDIYVEWKRLEVTGYTLPDSFVEAIRKVPAIYVETPFEERVDTLLTLYSGWIDHLDTFFVKLTEAKFDKDLIARLEKAASVSPRQFVSVLLTDYLDPLYVEEIGQLKIGWRVPKFFSYGCLNVHFAHGQAAAP